MNKVIPLLFLLTSSISFSQENRKVLYGVISDNLETLPRVHIINTTTKKATYSNDKGEFKIFAQPNDTIKITAIGYKTQLLLIDNKYFGIHENQIRLQKEIIELNEIEIKSHNLTGTLLSDLKNIKNTTEINAKTLQLPNANTRRLTVAERRLYTAYGGGLLGIDYIINVLSGRIKRLKKLKKIEDNEKEISQLKNTFTNYIINDLNINTSDLYRFIYFCQEDKNFKSQQEKGEFTIIEFLRIKAIEFKKLNPKP